MSKKLRMRRDALRAELLAVERDLRGGQTDTLASELRQELASASEFVTLIDDQGRVVHNARAQPGAPDITGRPILDFVADGYHEHVQAVIERAHRLGHPCPGRIEGRGGTGSAYHLWAVPLPVPVAGATTTLIGFDSSHLEQLERALQDESSAIHSLVKGIPDTVLLVDREHRVTYANNVRRMNEAEVFGADVVTLVPESERDRVRRVLDSVFAGGPSASYETHVDLPGGRYWYSTRVGPITRDGEVVRACLVSTEITEQRERELQLHREREALRQSELRFRVLVETAPEALGIMDAETGLFVEASDSACAWFGVERSEITRCRPIDFSPVIQPDGRVSEEAGRAYIKQALEEGHARFEWVCRSTEGRELECEVHLWAFPHGSRRLIRASAFDISERKRAERERAQLQDELLQAQKMQAIGQLTGGIAHDFNNLLAVIVSHAELLTLDARNEAGVLQHAEQILAASTRAAALTQQLLAFGRRQPLRTQRIELADLVAKMQDLLARSLGETILVKAEYGASLWSCVADRTQLENALLNLVLNARDAMPAGGTVTISMENRDVSAETRNPGVVPGRYVVITVADRGCGMSPEIAAKAFEPFFTTKDVGRGSGMGLSMVYGFAQQSGGHVELDTRPNEGTRVFLYLPAGDSADEEPAPARPEHAPRGRGELILIVEDDPAVRGSIVQTLQGLGYRTLDAPDAATALAELARTENVAFALIDLVLPGGVSGVQLARRVAKERPDLPIAFMSGYAEDVLARDGELPRDARLLRKPFTREELGATVHAALRAVASK